MSPTAIAAAEGPNLQSVATISDAISRDNQTPAHARGIMGSTQPKGPSQQHKVRRLPA